MPRETRDRTGEIRAVTDEGGVRSVTLHCIRPGVVDDYGSVWMPDTFDESLNERLPTLCWSHDWGEPLGAGVDFRTSDDGPEVIFEFDDFEAVPMARRAWVQIQPKGNGGPATIRDCSVGFSNTQRRDPTDEERERWPGVKEVITRAELDEVSLVLRGAVPGAKVLAVRSSPEASVDVAVELARRISAGEITQDEAKAALALLGTEPATTEAAAPPAEPVSEGEAEPEPEMVPIEDIDAALAIVADRSRLR